MRFSLFLYLSENSRLKSASKREACLDRSFDYDKFYQIFNFHIEALKLSTIEFKLECTGMLRNLKYKTISNLEIPQSGIVLSAKRQNSEIISEIIGSRGLPPTPEHHFYILIKLELISCFVELS